MTSVKPFKQDVYLYIQIWCNEYDQRHMNADINGIHQWDSNLTTQNTSHKRSTYCFQNMKNYKVCQVLNGSSSEQVVFELNRNFYKASMSISYPYFLKREEH